MRKLTEAQMKKIEGVPLGKMSEGLQKAVVDTIFPGGEWGYPTIGTKDTFKMMKEKGITEYKDENGNIYFSPLDNSEKFNNNGLVVMKYSIRKLIEGRAVGVEGKVVAVPDYDYDKKVSYDNDGPIEVVYKDQKMTISKWKDAITFRTFGDRLKRGTYRLGYFLWKPNN